MIEMGGVGNNLDSIDTSIRVAERALYSLGTYDGLCPNCGNVEGFNIRSVNMAGCREHKLCWQVGINLYSGWQHESEATWRENADLLATFKEIDASEAIYPEHEQKAKELQAEIQELKVKREEAFLKEAKAGLAATLQPLMYVEELARAMPSAKARLVKRMIESARVEIECISTVLDSGDIADDLLF
jgi:hypothetical protein